MLVLSWCPARRGLARATADPRRRDREIDEPVVGSEAREQRLLPGLVPRESRTADSDELRFLLSEVTLENPPVLLGECPDASRFAKPLPRLRHLHRHAEDGFVPGGDPRVTDCPPVGDRARPPGPPARTAPQKAPCFARLIAASSVKHLPSPPGSPGLFRLRVARVTPHRVDGVEPPTPSLTGRNRSHPRSDRVFGRRLPGRQEHTSRRRGTACLQLACAEHWAFGRE
jgi:hypothetical protein